MQEKYKTESGKWDLEEIARECERELKKIKIPIQRIVDVHVVRGKYIYGKVVQRYYDETWFDLNISNSYRNPKFKLDDIKTIICHLLLHTVKGCLNHDAKWLEYAQKADREYGLHIIEHAAARPEAGANWYDGSDRKASINNEKCCLLDYLVKLKELTEECSDELKSISLNVGIVSEVDFVRDDFAYGRCRKNRDKTFTIYVSYFYAKEEADRIGLKSLLCHELLHTCPEDDTVSATGVHGPKWREMARKVERKLGYKIMSQSHSDAVRHTSGKPIKRHVCPVCGGYYDIHEEKDKPQADAVRCKWCHHGMNAIREEDRGIVDPIYFLLGEMRDKLRIAGIPIGIISGIGFVPSDRQTGLHDNWNRSFSIDLPETYKWHGVENDSEFKDYLCRKLLGTCGSESIGEEYLQKAAEVLGDGSKDRM